MWISTEFKLSVVSMLSLERGTVRGTQYVIGLCLETTVHIILAHLGEERTSSIHVGYKTCMLNTVVHSLLAVIVKTASLRTSIL